MAILFLISGHLHQKRKKESIKKKKRERQNTKNKPQTHKNKPNSVKKAATHYEEAREKAPFFPPVERDVWAFWHKGQKCWSFEALPLLDCISSRLLSRATCPQKKTTTFTSDFPPSEFERGGCQRTNGGQVKQSARQRLTLSKDVARRCATGGVLGQHGSPPLLFVPPLHQVHAIGRQNLPASFTEKGLFFRKKEIEREKFKHGSGFLGHSASNKPEDCSPEEW